MSLSIKTSAAVLIIICAQIFAQTDAPAVRIPGGKFTRGSTQGKADEKPIREIEISTFSMMTKVVTEAQYQKCVNAGKCKPAHYDDGRCLQWTGTEFINVTVPRQFRGPNLPVVCVNWLQARAYCASIGMRMPSEAQWEYAALGGAKSARYSWGNSAPDKSRCALSSLHNAGSFAPNGYGLYDMTGNVWEWVGDFYEQDYYSYSEAKDPRGPTAGFYRVIRGGGFYSGPNELRIQNRHWFSPNFAEVSVGFRCVR
jgi:formylglycine-generating enzyme required for sulfatase activity